MRDVIALARLNHELGIWRRAWHEPVLWWRDDDAREPSWQLDRLLKIRTSLPMTLAVIPDVDLRPLAKKLATANAVSIAQHGVDHENRLPPGGPRSEFAADMAQESINAAVAAGKARLCAAGLAPGLFVPPWNEADDRLIAAIKAAGYSTWSGGKFGGPRDGLDHVGAQVDVLRWKGTPKFRGRRRIFDAFRRELEQRRAAQEWDKPLGFLTHHLVHDEETWRFLEWFVPFTRPRFGWRSADDFAPAGEASELQRKQAAA